jgi:hypothetical protein
MTADEALKEQYKQEAIGVGSQLAAGIGGQIGRAYASTGTVSGALDAYTSQDKFKDLLFPTGDGATAKIKFSPGTKNAKLPLKGQRGTRPVESRVCWQRKRS